MRKGREFLGKLTWECVGTGTWSVVNAKGTIPPARWGHKILVFNNTLYAFGGRDNVTNPNEMYEFNFGMDSRLSPPLRRLTLCFSDSHTRVEENSDEWIGSSIFLLGCVA